MRITNNLLIHNMLWNMNNNLVSMNEKQNQLASGKKIRRPSDDPIGITQVIKIKSDIAENIQYKDNVRDAESWLEVSENSLSDTKDILQRIRELAVQGANDTYTDEETEKIAKEIDQLIEEVIVNANSTIAGRYLFSGFNTDKPLLNKDGTFNVDITSEKINDFKAIAYEVAIGESLSVGVNYLDVYGAILKDNVVNNSFVFGNVSAGESRVGEGKGQSAQHSKIQGPVDYKKNLTTETMTIKVEGVTYSVDTSQLDGSLTKEEYIDVLKKASQTDPPASYPPPILGNVAEIYFVESKDSSNQEGELVIEAKAFGASKMSIGGTGNSFIENPKKQDGGAEVIGNTAVLEGIFDYKTNYTLPEKRLSFMVGGTNYYVLTGRLDGKVNNQADFLNILKNAESPEGTKLGDVATLTFDSLGGVSSVGKLKIVANHKHGETITFVDEGSGFKNPSVTMGKAEVKASLSGPFDSTKDLTTSVLSFAYKNKTYTVDTSTFDGSLTSAQIQQAIENADDGFGNLLSSVADVTYDGTTLTLSAKNAEDQQSFTYTDTGGGLTAVPTLTRGVEPVTADFEGRFNVPNLVGKPMTFSYSGKTYTVDTVGLTAANFSARVQAATDASGNLLGSVASVNFTVDSGDVGHLSIVANDQADSKIVINDTSLFTPTTSTVAGVVYKPATKASMTYIVDTGVDLKSSAKTLSITLGGKVYTVTAADLDGDISQSEFLDLIKNAQEPGGDKLSSVADISFDIHGDSKIGSLKIEAKTPGADTISIGGTGDVSVEYPVGSGPERAKIQGTFDYSKVYTLGSELAFDVDGQTYTVSALSFADSGSLVSAIENATDGSGNKLGDIMTISFDPSSGTSGTLTIEEKKGSGAVVDYTDSAGSFSGTVIKKNGTVKETDLVLTGTAEISDAQIADAKKGVGIQSFVVTYNDETKRIDVDMSGVNTKAEMETAVNLELEKAFGLNDDVPTGNNVKFEIVNNGSIDVVQFTADGKEDGSQTYLKVDVIASEKPQMVQDLEEFSVALKKKDNDAMQAFLSKIDVHLDNVIKTLADIGAKNNRLDFIENRIEDNNIAMTEILSKVQDIDYAEVTFKFKSLESIYRASLSVGAKVIQPTLVDFIQ